MNINATTSRGGQTPRPLLSTAARVAIGLAVAAGLTTLWLSAESASHQAVQASTQALSRNVIYVTLPTVEIIGQRSPAATAASAAIGSRDRAQRIL